MMTVDYSPTVRSCLTNGQQSDIISGLYPVAPAAGVSTDDPASAMATSQGAVRREQAARPVRQRKSVKFLLLCGHLGEDKSVCEGKIVFPGEDRGARECCCFRGSSLHSFCTLPEPSGHEGDKERRVS